MNYEKVLNQKLIVLNPLLRAMLITILLIVFFSYEYKPVFAQFDTFDYKGDTLRVSGEIALTFKAGSYNIKRDKAEEEIIDMQEFYATSSPGDPYLPFRIYDIVVPPNIDWKTIKLNFKTETFEIPGKHKIKPAPPFATRIDDEEVLDWGENKEIVNGRNLKVYGLNTFFPQEPIKIVSQSQMRKWKFLRLGFIPVQYNPANGKVLLNKTVKVKLTFKRIGTKTFRANPILSDTLMDLEARERFFNFKNAREWYRYMPDFQGLEKGENFDYVIITTNAIVAGSGSGLTDFVNHKKDLGYSVRVVTEGDYDAVAAPPPDGKADKIRKWLKDNYISLGIKWVLLIGNPYPNDNNSDLPMKMCHPKHINKNINCPTDHFYANLSGDWDLDDDGIYGESPDDKGVGGVDFTAEVFVGRIPLYIANYDTLNRILKKIIDYETAASIPDWRRRILLPMKPAESTPACNLGERIKDDCIIPAALGYYRIYDPIPKCDTNPPPEKVPCTEENVLAEWKNGYGLVTWFTHGSAWSAESVFSIDSYSELNDGKPSFTFQGSCNNGYPEYIDNLGFSLLKNGAIGTVSATRITEYFPESMNDWEPNNTSGLTQDLAYFYSCRLLRRYAVGSSLFITKSESHNWLNNMGYNLYGDPSTFLFSLRGNGFKGTVFEGAPTSPTARVIPYAEITFIRKDGLVIKTVKTDSSGSYRIALSKGTYMYTAKHPGYFDYTSYPRFYEVTDEGYQLLNIYMKKRIKEK